MVVLRKPQVRQKLGGISPSGLANLINRRGFPKPFYIWGKLAAWDEQDVDRWLEVQKLSQRGEENGTNRSEAKSS